jgi:hypothetical protein
MARRVEEFFAGFEDDLMTRPEAFKIYADFLSKLRQMGENHPDRTLWDLVVQKRSDHDYTLGDVFVFGRVLKGLNEGDLAWLTIRVGKEPGLDLDILGNNDILSTVSRDSDGVINAVFAPERGGGADCDGALSWSEEISASVMHDGKIDNIKLEPNSLPLEVGTTDSATTWMHITSGGIARWPYGHNEVKVIIPYPYSRWYEALVF